MIPKSTHRERIVENAKMFDFALTDEDMARSTRSTAPAAPPGRANEVVVRAAGHGSA